MFSLKELQGFAKQFETEGKNVQEFLSYITTQEYDVNAYLRWFSLEELQATAKRFEAEYGENVQGFFLFLVEQEYVREKKNVSLFIDHLTKLIENYPEMASKMFARRDDVSNFLLELAFTVLPVNDKFLHAKFLLKVSEVLAKSSYDTEKTDVF